MTEHSYQYDLVVIGGGPGGYVAAIRAAQLGFNTALVEKAELGGTCLNRGCVPTKALLHAAELYAGLAEAARWGVRVGDATLDIAAMHARKDEVVAGLRGGISQLLQANGVTVVTGTAALENAHTVSVGEETLTCGRVLIATGSVPTRLPLPGADLPDVLTSDELLRETQPLQKLIIVGGGVIGVEFASLYAALGAEVVIVEAMERLLPTMEREIAQNLALIFKKRGVQVRTGAKVLRFEQAEAGIRCVFAEKGTEQSVTGDRVLVCVGRKPYTDGLLRPGCGLEAERGIAVDGRGRTTLPGVWAIGDVTGGIQLAHYASAQGMAAVEDMAGILPSMPLDVVPSCVYTAPEIASVGMAADEAKAAGREVITGKYVLNGNARTVIAGAERSFVKVVAAADSHVLLGAQLMCERASDLIGELAVGIANGLTLEQAHAAMHGHPTFGEAIGEALLDALGRAVHAAPRRR